MTKPTRRILIVDDDPQNNSLSKMTLKISLGEVDVKDFLIPEVALEYIETEFANYMSEEKTTLFLDINMPSLTGWEFLDIFNTFTDSVKKQFNIYILSSSIDPADIQRAKLNPLVTDFVEKPLSKSMLIKIFN